MEISYETQGQCLLVFSSGRLDAFGSKQFQSELEAHLSEKIICVVVDMAGVNYLSSAGLRVLLKDYKSLNKTGGTLVLVNIQPYCKQVLDMAGFSLSFPMFNTIGEAMNFCNKIIQAKNAYDNWEDLEVVNLDCGTVRIIAGSDESGALEILGDVKDVLYSRVTPAHLCSKRFSDTAYSLGLGGLGERIDDYFRVMGEMIMIGGTMVWLPTDGHDTPDFLIPKKDTGDVTLRTGFNASIAGDFNETFIFESNKETGTPIDKLYRTFFNLSKDRRKDFKGILGLAMRAQVAKTFGTGIAHSPIKSNAPTNDEMIVHPSNFDAWFEVDTEPRHTDITGLICGIGADLSADLSGYDEQLLNCVFYLNPANTGGKSEMLHNHTVIFDELSFPEKPVNIEKEIRAAVDEGDFIDMRHLLDNSTIKKAIIGVNYIQSFRPDPQGRKGV